MNVVTVLQHDIEIPSDIVPVFVMTGRSRVHYCRRVCHDSANVAETLDKGLRPDWAIATVILALGAALGANRHYG